VPKSSLSTEKLAALFLLGVLMFSPPLIAIFDAGVTISGIPLLYIFCSAPGRSASVWPPGLSPGRGGGQIKGRAGKQAAT